MPKWSDLIHSKREADKPAVLLHLADCGVRDGMDGEQLNALRLEVAYAYESKQNKRINAAKGALLEFYRAQLEIRNGDHEMTPEQATISDVERLVEAVRQYDPQHQHPNYGRS